MRAEDHNFGYTVIGDVSVHQLRLPLDRAAMARYEWFGWLKGGWKRIAWAGPPGTLYQNCSSSLTGRSPSAAARRSTHER
jgi:hypothetical protein